MPSFSLRALRLQRRRELIAAHGRDKGQEIAKAFDEGKLEMQKHWRPKTYGECKDLPRPCPFVGCRYHLFLEQKKNGSLKIMNQEIEQMPKSCALDLADEGDKTLEEVGSLLGMSSERVRQIEMKALKYLAQANPALKDYIETKKQASNSDEEFNLADLFSTFRRCAPQNLVNG